MTAKPIFSRCMVIVALGILLLGIGGLPSQARELDPDPAATVRISEASDGTQANSSSGGAYPSDTNSISADGRFVAFSSGASNLVEGDTNGYADVFVRDRDVDGDGIFDEPGSVSTVRVSVTSSGGQANRGSYQPTISSDGRFVAFTSTATNLDTSALGSNDYMDEDIFVHDRLTGSTRQLSVRVYQNYTNDGNQHSSYPSISGDGSVVAYQSTASNPIIRGR